MKELTIQEACTNPQNFMYLWADEERFLPYIKPEYREVIVSKKANQRKLILLSAQRYINKNAVMDGAEYMQYTNAIRQAFIEQWDANTPAEALVILAQGGSIAGKNWSEGVYGIGSTPKNTFSGHTDITVREKDGYFERNGKILPGDEDMNVYANVGGKVVVYQRFYQDPQTGITYCSQMNKLSKKYYAATYSTADGTFSAKSGNAINKMDRADIWGAIIESLDRFFQWIMSIFGSNTPDRELINANNTLPSQKTDGFVQEGGGTMLESSGILLALAAAGILLAGGIKMPKSKK